MTVVQTTIEGYLDDTYMDGPYMGGIEAGNIGVQFNMVIADTSDPQGVQYEGQIVDFSDPQGVQAQQDIADSEKPLGVEVVINVAETSSPVGVQFEQNIVDSLHELGVEFIQDSLSHTICTGYLDEAYLGGAYLAPRLCANLGVQFLQNIVDFSDPSGVQYDGQLIDTPNPVGTQYQGVIADTPDPLGVQAQQFGGDSSGIQYTAVIYNTTQLRVLCEFLSRGITTTNWTASSTESGDFDVNNLDTDIVEQIWRSATGVKSVNLDSDTGIPQGVFLDTAAILNHNLTTSATVTLQGSVNSSFSPVGVSHSLLVEEENMYFIAEDLPTAGFRYWRFVIDDASNPNTHLSIGTIVFGASTILQGECFVDRVVRGKTHFKDMIETEGFTNVMNDRGTKKNLTLEFRAIDFNGGNFSNLQDIFNLARTHLKCLWIPVPFSNGVQTASRFAMFSKMLDIPQEEHNFKNKDNDHVDFIINLDESL